MVAELVVRSQEAKYRSRELLAHSRFLLARSDAKLRRVRAPSGAADTPDPILQARITRTTEKTRRGALPAPFDGKLWVGFGSLRPCDGCADKIEAADREYEVELVGGLTFLFHPVCYHVWKSYPPRTRPVA